MTRQTDPNPPVAQPLDYRTPYPKPQAGVGKLLRGASLLLTVGGVIAAFAGTVGPDNKQQMWIGCLIAAFGFTWAALGHILHVLETPR